MNTPISYAVIADACDFYARRGYSPIEVPWFVDDRSCDVTKPAWCKYVRVCETNDKSPAITWGNLVGSAEQGFVEMMIRQRMPTGMHFATTPCFRPEPVHKLSDEVRQYFMKVELINYWGRNTPGALHLKSMIDDALSFMGERANVSVIETADNEYDIVCKNSHLELGSYGIRQYETHNWIYGTGVAEPRFSIAMKEMK